MADRGKVIKGLECCSRVSWLCPTVACPYYGKGHEFGCSLQLKRDAFELLKEQDKTIESLTKEKERLLLERIAELQHNIDALHATKQDTILVNNAIEQRKGGEVE